ncbi:hypothetical protein BC827DRAFT_1157576 [Russula dissimulans]|nr:hypothetical protein BC827DRAFT_1157576 [Russula dissimulans]
MTQQNFLVTLSRLAWQAAFGHAPRLDETYMMLAHDVYLRGDNTQLLLCMYWQSSIIHPSDDRIQPLPSGIADMAQRSAERKPIRTVEAPCGSDKAGNGCCTWKLRPPSNSWHPDFDHHNSQRRQASDSCDRSSRKGHGRMMATQDSDSGFGEWEGEVSSQVPTVLELCPKISTNRRFGLSGGFPASGA